MGLFEEHLIETVMSGMELGFGSRLTQSDGCSLAADMLDRLDRILDLPIRWNQPCSVRSVFDNVEIRDVESRKPEGCPILSEDEAGARPVADDELHLINSDCNV